MTEHSTFQRIGLIGKPGDPGIADILHSLKAFFDQHNRVLIVDPEVATAMADPSLEPVDIKAMGEQCDLAIVVGGDGTLLHAARELNEFKIPMVGINRGRLGFLVDVSPTDMLERLDEILAGRYVAEERCLLHARVERDGVLLQEAPAMNDVVLHKWEVARMIEFETYINGHYVHTTHADGMIVSTPTGSTAYALSGGGPVIEPSLDAIVLVPICPHTLSNRPLVVPASDRIEIVISPGHQNDAQVTFDGQIHLRIEQGDRIQIAVSQNKTTLLHPEGYDYYKILRAKLRWAEHYRQG